MSKLEKFVFYLLIFSIPFQTRVFLYSSEIVEGFNEWQSVFLYGTDILIGILFLHWMFRLAKRFSHYAAAPRAKRESFPPAQTRTKRFGRGGLTTVRKALNQTSLILIFLFFSAISILSAQYWDIGLYRFVKLFEFIWLFFYIIKIPSASTTGNDEGVKFSSIAIIFGLSGFLQGVFAIWQFLIQRSIGLKWLGESSLEAGSQEVAEIVAQGARFIRSYGTFPSPNVLAAFLAISIMFVVTWYIGRSYRLHRHFFFAAISLITMTLALLLTFSRAVIGIFVAVMIFYFLTLFFSKRFEKRFKIAAFHIVLILVLVSVVFGIIYSPELYSRFFINTFEHSDEAVLERSFLNSVTSDILSTKLSGVGLGNFTFYFRDMYSGLRDAIYQPVHNIFFLTLAEGGILAGIFFMLFVLSLLWQGFVRFIKESNLRPEHLFVITSILFFVGTGFFDHYYLTLQQGSLIFWVVLALAYSYSK